MRNVFEWLSANPDLMQKPWLILGKGPSFSKRHDFNLQQFSSLALNDAAREQSVDLAHAIDIDVVRRSGEAIAANARALVMPWHPHVDFDAGQETLAQYAERHPVLRKLSSDGRLLWYNLSTSRDHRPGSPVVSAKFFSAEAAVNLLATAGVRTIRSLGVDGGAKYSPAFKDLNDKSLLANRRKSFDIQFREIAKTILRTGIDFAPLDVESPVRVYVATTDAQMLAVKVLEYSIRKHASMTVNVYPMHLSGIEIPVPKEPRNQPRTPFSFQRYLIPELADRKGRAIYLDSDMQVFADIRDLWMTPFNGAHLLAIGDTGDSGRRPQFSVMLLDCAALDWKIGDIVARLDAGGLTYEQLVYEMSVAGSIRADIPQRWNSLEVYREDETALLHYTDMESQPWVYADHPDGYLWVSDLMEAVDAGFIQRAEVVEHVQKGWVRPSMLWQLDHREADGLLLPRAARLLDRDFKPPYLSLPGQRGSRPNRMRSPKALLRALCRRTGLWKLYRRMPARAWRRGSS